MLHTAEFRNLGPAVNRQPGFRREDTLSIRTSTHHAKVQALNIKVMDVSEIHYSEIMGPLNVAVH